MSRFRISDTQGLWETTRTLLHQKKAEADQHALLIFVCAFVEGQREHIVELRGDIFLTISSLTLKGGKNWYLIFTAIQLLTRNGRQSVPFTTQLLDWLIEAAALFRNLGAAKKKQSGSKDFQPRDFALTPSNEKQSSSVFVFPTTKVTPASATPSSTAYSTFSTLSGPTSSIAANNTLNSDGIAPLEIPETGTRDDPPGPSRLLPPLPSGGDGSNGGGGDNDTGKSPRHGSGVNAEEKHAIKVMSQLFLTFVNQHSPSLSSPLAIRIIRAVCDMSKDATDSFIAYLCLPCIELVVQDLDGSVSLDSNLLSLLIGTLCEHFVVNNKECWKIVNRVLHSHMGLLALHDILHVITCVSDHKPHVLRGGVFFVAMSCWGSRRVASLNVPFSIVLPHLVGVLACKDASVLYEVFLSLNRLIRKYGAALTVEWDVVIEALIECHTHMDSPSTYEAIVQNTFSSLAALIKNDSLFADEELTLRAFLLYSPLLGAAELDLTVSLMMNRIHPINTDWLVACKDYLTHFLIQQESITIQQKTLSNFHLKFESFGNLFGDTLISNAFLPAAYDVCEVSLEDLKPNTGLQQIDSLETALPSKLPSLGDPVHYSTADDDTLHLLDARRMCAQTAGTLAVPTNVPFFGSILTFLELLLWNPVTHRPQRSSKKNATSISKKQEELRQELLLQVLLLFEASLTEVPHHHFSLVLKAIARLGSHPHAEIHAFAIQCMLRLRCSNSGQVYLAPRRVLPEDDAADLVADSSGNSNSPVPSANDNPILGPSLYVHCAPLHRSSGNTVSPKVGYLPMDLFMGALFKSYEHWSNDLELNRMMLDEVPSSLENYHLFQSCSSTLTSAIASVCTQVERICREFVSGSISGSGARFQSPTAGARASSSGSSSATRPGNATSSSGDGDSNLRKVLKKAGFSLPETKSQSTPPSHSEPTVQQVADVIEGNELLSLFAAYHDIVSSQLLDEVIGIIRLTAKFYSSICDARDEQIRSLLSKGIQTLLSFCSLHHHHLIASPPSFAVVLCALGDVWRVAIARREWATVTPIVSYLHLIVRYHSATPPASASANTPSHGRHDVGLPPSVSGLSLPRSDMPDDHPSTNPVGATYPTGLVHLESAHLELVMDMLCPALVADIPDIGTKSSPALSPNSAQMHSRTSSQSSGSTGQHQTHARHGSGKKSSEASPHSPHSDADHLSGVITTEPMSDLLRHMIFRSCCSWYLLLSNEQRKRYAERVQSAFSSVSLSMSERDKDKEADVNGQRNASVYVAVFLDVISRLSGLQNQINNLSEAHNLLASSAQSNPSIVDPLLVNNAAASSHQRAGSHAASTSSPPNNSALIRSQSWVHGCSILTVRSRARSDRSGFDLVHLVVRRVSGTVSWVAQLQNGLPWQRLHPQLRTPLISVALEQMIPAGYAHASAHHISPFTVYEDGDTLVSGGGGASMSDLASVSLSASGSAHAIMNVTSATSTGHPAPHSTGGGYDSVSIVSSCVADEEFRDSVSVGTTTASVANSSTSRANLRLPKSSPIPLPPKAPADTPNVPIMHLTSEKSLTIGSPHPPSFEYEYGQFRNSASGNDDGTIDGLSGIQPSHAHTYSESLSGEEEDETTSSLGVGPRYSGSEEDSLDSSDAGEGDDEGDEPGTAGDRRRSSHRHHDHHGNTVDASAADISVSVLEEASSSFSTNFSSGVSHSPSDEGCGFLMSPSLGPLKRKPKDADTSGGSATAHPRGPSAATLGDSTATMDGNDSTLSHDVTDATTNVPSLLLGHSPNSLTTRPNQHTSPALSFFEQQDSIQAFGGGGGGILDDLPNPSNPTNSSSSTREPRRPRTQKGSRRSSDIHSNNRSRHDTRRQPRESHRHLKVQGSRVVDEEEDDALLRGIRRGSESTRNERRSKEKHHRGEERRKSDPHELKGAIRERKKRLKATAERKRRAEEEKEKELQHRSPTSKAHHLRSASKSKSDESILHNKSSILLSMIPAAGSPERVVGGQYEKGAAVVLAGPDGSLEQPRRMSYLGDEEEKVAPRRTSAPHINSRGVNAEVQTAEPSMSYLHSLQLRLQPTRGAFTHRSSRSGSMFESHLSSHRGDTADRRNSYMSVLSELPNMDETYSSGGGSIPPAFTFFNLYDPSILQSDCLALEGEEQLLRALNVLDRTPCRDTVKIGVVYVGEGQTSELDILSNAVGSPRYERFIRCLGTLHYLNGCPHYTGGLDSKTDIDGQLALLDVQVHTEICYHVATLIPTREKHRRFENKKRHIGNDFVNIVYSDSEKEFTADMIPSKFTLVHIVVSPVRGSVFRVRVLCKYPDLVPFFGPLAADQTALVEETALPFLVSETAVQANFACVARRYVSSKSSKKQQAQSQTTHIGSFVSNWHERLVQIQRVRDRHGVASLPLDNASDVLG